MKALNRKLEKNWMHFRILLANIYNQLEPFQGALGRGGGLDCCCENLVHRVLILQQVNAKNSPVYRENKVGLVNAQNKKQNALQK